MSFKLSDMQPSRALRPARRSERRVTVEDGDLVLSYLWDAETRSSEWQTTNFANFHSLLRVSTLQDEGDIGGAMCMAQHGLSVNIHRDTSHKLAREEVLAAGSIPEVVLIKKQIGLICKYDKAPWKSSSFGRRLSEAKELIDMLPETHTLIEMCAPGIIDDLGLDPATDLRQVKAAVVSFCKGKTRTGTDHKSGRWMDFTDSYSRLRREWHCRLCVHLFALLLEGKNPMRSIADCLSVQGSEDDVALQPKVLRVQLDKCRAGTASLRRYVALEWPNLMLSTMQSGLDHIKEILGTLDQSQVSDVLRIHFKHLIATVQHFSEFALMFQNFPWRFALLLDADEAVVARTARECKEEWEFLLRQEELCADASKCFPLKDVPFVRWYAYREPMTFMEERRFKVDDDVRSLVRAWQADPSSTLGCEDSFRNLRTGERAHGGGEI
ncbi:unnamed protein product, partial [Symbiodinium sp. KB8]